jgi:hypothetical protein
MRMLLFSVVLRMFFQLLPPLVAFMALLWILGTAVLDAIVAGDAKLNPDVCGHSNLRRPVLHAEQTGMATFARVALYGVLITFEQYFPPAASGPDQGLAGPYCRSIPRQDDKREKRSSSNSALYPLHGLTS